MISDQIIYELFLDNTVVYSSINSYYVFHEYLSYNKINIFAGTNCLVIKKKLNDPSKKFPLYFETICYDNTTNKFYGSDTKYEYCANNFFSQESKPELKIKVHDKKKLINTKIKVIDYKTNRQILPA